MIASLILFHFYVHFMKTNFSLLFYLKKPKNYQAGLQPIYIRITVNGQRAEFTSGRECLSGNWNAAAGRPKGTKEDIKTLNAYLDNLQSQIYEAHYQQTVSGKPVTASELKNRMLGKSQVQTAGNTFFSSTDTAYLDFFNHWYNRLFLCPDCGRIYYQSRRK